MEKILRPKDVSEMLGVSIMTLQVWDNKGKLKAHRDKNNWRYYKKDDILEFVRKNKKYETFESVKNHKKFKELSKKIVLHKEDFEKFTKFDYEYICKSINDGKTDYDEIITKDFYADLFFSIYDLDDINLVKSIIEKTFMDNIELFIKNYEITTHMTNLLNDTIFFIGLFDIHPEEIDKFADYLWKSLFYNNNLEYDRVYELIYNEKPDFHEEILTRVKKSYKRIKISRQIKGAFDELNDYLEMPFYVKKWLFIDVLFY